MREPGGRRARPHDPDTGVGARAYLTKPLDAGTLLKTLGETTDER